MPAERGSVMTLLNPKWTVVVPQPDLINIPLAFPLASGDLAWASFINGWIELKRRDGSLDGLYSHWILGSVPGARTAPRWSVIRNVLTLGGVTMPEANQGTALDRFLRLFTDVKAGEGKTALLLSLNVFLILMAYYVLKPVREALILAGLGGTEDVHVGGAGGRAGDRRAGRTAASWTGWIAAASSTSSRRSSSSCLLVFYMLGRAGVPLGMVFFLWIGIFNLMIVAQFWSFANDVYTKDQGERLFAIVGFGASLGAVFGSRFVGTSSSARRVRADAGGRRAAGRRGVLTNYIDRRESGRTRVKAAPEPSGTETRAQRVRDGVQDALLAADGVHAAVPQYREHDRGVHPGQHRQGRRGQAGRDDDRVRVGAAIGQFYATYFTYVNVLGLVLQLFVVSRVVKYLGRADRRHDPAGALADGLRRHHVHPDPQGGAGGEGRGELDRLFDQQHHSQHAVPAVHMRTEVQRQAGDRFVLRPDGRRLVGRAGLCRHGRIRSASPGLRHRSTPDWW